LPLIVTPLPCYATHIPAQDFTGKLERYTRYPTADRFVDDIAIVLRAHSYC